MTKKYISIFCLVLVLSSPAHATKKQEWVSQRVVAGLSLVSVFLYYTLFSGGQYSSHLREGTRKLDSDSNSTSALPVDESSYSDVLNSLYPNGIFGDNPGRRLTESEQQSQLLLKPSKASNLTVSLPQFDSEPEVRSNALLAIQAQIQNYPRSYAYDGIHEEPLSRGPVPFSGSLAQKMVVQEIADILARATQNSSIIIPKELFSLPMNTLDEIGDLYTHMNGYPVPNGLTHWRDDRYFADLRRTYLGHNLKKLRRGKPLFDVGLDHEQVEKLLGEGRTFETIELYGSDFSEVGNYTAKDGRPQYAPSAQMMYGMNRENEFVVLAIQLGNGFVYTRLDTEQEWTLAKIAANTAEFLWTSAVHFSRTHILVEPLRTETMRHLSVNHPLFILLNLHMKNLFGNTVAGLVSLFSRGTVLDQVSGWGAQGYMKFFGDHPQDYTDFSRTLKADIDQRGLTNLKDFRQLKDKQGLFAHIRAFLHSYLIKFYGESAVQDKNVVEDYELQAWAKACSAPDGAGVTHFPSEFSSLIQLEDTLVQIIYLVGIEHHAMNSNALWHGYPLPATSMALWAPLPTAKGQPIDPRSYLAPTPAGIEAQILLMEFFLRKLNLEDSLAESYDSLNLGSTHLGEILVHYKRNMQRLQESIEDREQKEKERARYTILSPKNVPDFVWIR